MVRINLIQPKYLTDQHLIAEYVEIIMLVVYIRQYPFVKVMFNNYCLGTGHQVFFKNKVLYLKKRFESIKGEMIKRGFNPKMDLEIKDLPKELQKDWKPCESDKKVIRKRLVEKINLKPTFYRYYKKQRTKKFLIELIKNSK